MSSVGYLYCRDCAEFMDEVEALRFTPEVHDELEGKPTEWIGERRCIYCGSDDLEEADECQECGELFPESELDDEGVCEDCRKEYEDAEL